MISQSSIFLLFTPIFTALSTISLPISLFLDHTATTNGLLSIISESFTHLAHQNIDKIQSLAKLIYAH